MEDIPSNIINDADKEYEIIIKNKDAILNEIDFDNEDDKLICDAIITNLEKNISDSIRSMKVAQIPFIGCVRINPIKRNIRDNYINFRIARKNMTKEQYKDHVRGYVIDLKEKQKEIDRFKLNIIRIKRNNKNKYDTLYKKLGRVYAEMFIYSIYLLKDIPFDEEWEEQYKLLNN